MRYWIIVFVLINGCVRTTKFRLIREPEGAPLSGAYVIIHHSKDPFGYINNVDANGVSDGEGYFSVTLPAETGQSRRYFRIEHEEYLVVTERPTTKPVDEPDYPRKGVTYLFVKRYDPPVLHEHPADVARRAAGK